jgi:hypothetical protein
MCWRGRRIPTYISLVNTVQLMILRHSLELLICNIGHAVFSPLCMVQSLSDMFIHVKCIHDSDKQYLMLMIFNDCQSDHAVSV